MRKLRIAILTQPDDKYIPRNINRFKDVDYVNIVSVLEITSGAVMSSKAKRLILAFGVMQSIKLLFAKLRRRLIDLVDRLLTYRLHYLCSNASAANSVNATFMTIDNPNTDQHLSYLRSLEVDVIVSFSAPCVFQAELLALPRLGCVNLHCSLLPDYAGIMPSFWTLYNDEEYLGCTVHIMDSKIDNGSIVAQKKIPNTSGKSISKAVEMTKTAGGVLMLDVIKKIACEGKIETQDTPKPDAHTNWPSLKELKEFRRSGGRLI